MSSQYLRIFQQPRSAILLILGFASGLPLALTSGTLQAWMTVENIDLKTIGFFSLVGQAYVFKFLWSPLMDRYTPPFFGRRRGWLLATQILLLVAIAAMGFLEPGTQLRWMAALAVVIAFCSASQDIVFDAWKTDVLPAEERGAGAAISVLGYRLGMLVSGGLALWLADKWLGWQGMYWLMAALLIPCIIATLLAPEPTDTIPVPKTLEQAVVAPLRDFFGRNNAWLILLLVCRQTLEYTRVNDNFISRTAYPAGYAFAMWTLAAGVSLLAVWLLLLTMDALDLTHFSFLPALLEVGVLVALSGVVLGGLLDYLALRKTHLT
ncbi:MFS transporter [Escherichia coli]|nr:MFS transporter [Escherichia coli]